MIPFRFNYATSINKADRSASVFYKSVQFLNREHDGIRAHKKSAQLKTEELFRLIVDTDDANANEELNKMLEEIQALMEYDESRLTAVLLQQSPELIGNGSRKEDGTKGVAVHMGFALSSR